MAETDTNQPAGEEVNPRKGEDNYQTLFNNSKLTYDKFLDIVSSTSVRSSDFNVQVNNVALQALQNSVETANMVSKNAAINMDLATKHALNNFAISVNKQWNLDIPEAASQVEVLKAVGMDSQSIAAIQAAVATAVTQALTDKD